MVEITARRVLLGSLIAATLIISLVELSFGFHYAEKPELCPIRNDIMLIMAIGGVFQIIFFAATLVFIYTLVPAKYKKEKNKTLAQKTAQGNSRASLIIIGCITSILGGCAIIFFVILQIRVYDIYGKIQTSNTADPNYCLFTIYSSAFGLIIASYVAYILLIIIAIIFLCGLCIPKDDKK